MFFFTKVRAVDTPAPVAEPEWVAISAVYPLGAEGTPKASRRCSLSHLPTASRKRLTLSNSRRTMTLEPSYLCR
jgi:hypothetical protein